MEIKRNTREKYAIELLYEGLGVPPGGDGRLVGLAVNVHLREGERLAALEDAPWTGSAKRMSRTESYLIRRAPLKREQR